MIPFVRYLIWFWAPPGQDVALQCPPPVAGEPADPSGVFDPDTVREAFRAAGLTSLLVVLLLVLACYLFTRTSTGPRFSKRWVGFAATAGALAFAVPIAVLRAWPTHALAETCETNPEQFLAKLPWDLILTRGVAGLIWGLLAFLLISVMLTRALGRYSWMGGFFHNRGTPWPRLIPWLD